MANVYHQVLIPADRKTVYDALTSQKGLSKWWIADCKVKAEVGFVNEFYLQGHATNYMKVVALKPDTFVEWECLNHDDAWTGTRATFSLSDRGNYTCLDFKHTGYVSEDEFYATCNYHWARHLFMLKGYCETGIPLLDQQQEQKECEAVFESKLQDKL
ncbi:SRPBCC family protein [Pontibacter sp. H249]|uniref:SRPBCC family protein n=1 Tax=Pontibacter sp. H249 TaxID=3133420 RepID=UPI0030BDB235